jgi:hypothetical protein
MATERWTRWAGVGLAALALGCGGPRAEVRGKAPTGAATPVAALRREAAATDVTVRGRMVEK